MSDFGMQDVYTLHIKKNRTANQIISPNCESCLNGFIHVNTLQVRQFTQTGKLPGVCKSCNAQFLKICRNQIRHMNQSENPSHACDICGKTFTHAGNYLKHKKLHEAATLANLKTIEMMQCNSGQADVNGEVKSEKENLSAENEKQNVEKENHSLGNEEAEKASFTKAKPEPPYICEICNKSFQKYGSYLNHCENHKDNLVCPICEKVCTTKTILKNHIARCESRQPTYMCHYCEKCFDTKSSLKLHMENHAIQQETHVCKFCKETFVVAEELEKHLLQHLNEHASSKDKDQDKFNHFCVDCGKGFVNLGSLKKHTLTHEGDVPFECKNCKKQFVQSHRLVRHLKICKKKNTKVSHTCKVCSKTFSFQKSLNRHKLLHKAATRLRSTVKKQS